MDGIGTSFATFAEEPKFSKVLGSFSSKFDRRVCKCFYRLSRSSLHLCYVLKTFGGLRSQDVEVGQQETKKRDHRKFLTPVTACNFYAPDSVLGSGRRVKVTLWIPMIQRLGQAYKLKPKRLSINISGCLTLLANKHYNCMPFRIEKQVHGHVKISSRHHKKQQIKKLVNFKFWCPNFSSRSAQTSNSNDISEFKAEKARTARSQGLA